MLRSCLLVLERKALRKRSQQCDRSGLAVDGEREPEAARLLGHDQFRLFPGVDRLTELEHRFERLRQVEIVAPRDFLDRFPEGGVVHVSDHVGIRRTKRPGLPRADVGRLGQLELVRDTATVRRLAIDGCEVIAELERA